LGFNLGDFGTLGNSGNIKIPPLPSFLCV